MEEYKGWFPAKKSKVVMIGLLFAGALLTLNPVAFGATTADGTSWQNIIATITFLGCPIVVLLDLNS
jgi:hypothetical protein